MRSISQVVSTAAELERRGIALKVLSRGMNTSTPEGRLHFRVTAAFDEFQREPVVEIARSGLEADRRRGRYGGRPRAIDDRLRKLAERCARAR